ncbi:hypothetical protein [Methylobacterium durans]|uniref:Uncharacterized protein n=1 Tax=Methylobacterium durans TaxID=2202825 RepID=A0A2U8WDX9_9HYPH|nr:hypothetical protein [Methylobacterium durans]AWN43482.1 hypothetical protein DK389_26965 [Methylobacterium durans]
MTTKKSKKPAEKPEAKARRGRPTRDEALRRAIRAAGVDSTLIDPKRILAGIAVDRDAPATARVAACKALMAANAGLPAVLVDPGEVPEEDEMSRRALALMAQRGVPN